MAALLSLLGIVGFLAGAGCWELLTRARIDRAADQAYGEGRADMRRHFLEGVDAAPLAPLPGHRTLADTDTRARMYAQLGPAQGRQPDAAGRGRHGRAGDLEAEEWDRAAAERLPTPVELALDQEYRRVWGGIAEARDSALIWYGQTFNTGQFRAIGR